MTTLRAQRFLPIVHVTCETAHTYIPMTPEPKDLTEVDVHIKRMDGTELGENDGACCAPWLLRYPAHDYRRGSIGFRWDGELHKLPPGQYIAEIQIDCVPCHRFTLLVTKPRFGGTSTGLSVRDVI